MQSFVDYVRNEMLSRMHPSSEQAAIVPLRRSVVVATEIHTSPPKGPTILNAGTRGERKR
jgi:hypothetical protein